MEVQTLIFVFLFLFLSLTFFIGRLKRTLNLPPSPAWELPVIGHLRLLRSPLHRVFLSVSQSLGDAPIFSIRLGNVHSIAEECFTKNDVVLANHQNSIASKHISYGSSSVVSASYSQHWRNLRRIGAVEIFSAHRLK